MIHVFSRGGGERGKDRARHKGGGKNGEKNPGFTVRGGGNQGAMKT